MKYICDTCGAIYDEALGDPKRKVPAGTAFADLPKHYACPLCGADKDSFLPADHKAETAQRNDTQEFWNNAKYSDAIGDSQR